MYETKLAERVIKLCPDLMGMARTSEQLLSDPRTVQSLVNLVEQLTDELVNTEQLAKDRYCKMQTEIECLRDALYEIAHMLPIRRIQGDAQKVAKKALEIK